MNRAGGCRLFWCGRASLHLAVCDPAAISFGDPILPDEFGEGVREVVQGFLGDFVHVAAPVRRDRVSRARGVRGRGRVIRENRVGRKGDGKMRLYIRLPYRAVRRLQKVLIIFPVRERYPSYYCHIFFLDSAICGILLRISADV